MAQNKIQLPRDTLQWGAEAHETGFIEAYLDDGVPVLICEAGRYPNALLPDGSSTGDVPHVLINIGGWHSNGTKKYAGFSVSAVGTDVHGHGRALSVHSAPSYSMEGGEDTPDAVVEEAKGLVSHAKEVLASLDGAYAAARVRVSVLQSYPRELSRHYYEAACAACGVESLPDEQCSVWGVFEYPHYTADQVVKLVLSQKRARQIEQQRDEEHQERARQASLARRLAPQMEGQLWECCPHCRREPVYMPLMVCATCWPTDESVEAWTQRTAIHT